MTKPRLLVFMHNDTVKISRLSSCLLRRLSQHAVGALTAALPCGYHVQVPVPVDIHQPDTVRLPTTDRIDSTAGRKHALTVRVPEPRHVTAGRKRYNNVRVLVAIQVANVDRSV